MEQISNQWTVENVIRFQCCTTTIFFFFKKQKKRTSTLKYEISNIILSLFLFKKDTAFIVGRKQNISQYYRFSRLIYLFFKDNITMTLVITSLCFLLSRYLSILVVAYSCLSSHIIQCTRHLQAEGTWKTSSRRSLLCYVSSTGILRSQRLLI